MSETSMWLFPVAMAAAIGLIIGLRSGLAWNWGMCLQQGLILLVTATGFYFLYAPAALGATKPAEDAAQVCTWIAWTLFLIFNIGQRLILNQLSLNLSLLKVKEANSRLWLIPLLCWGPPGQYWIAMAKALAMYYEGATSAADTLITSWREDKRIPQHAKEGLLGFSMLGRVLSNDWQAITTNFGQHQEELVKSKAYVPLQLASRAFAEQQLYPESLACLITMLGQSSRNSTITVDVNFVPFFALAGARDQLIKIFENCQDKQSLPEYSRLFWLARCHAFRGEPEKAAKYFLEARAKTPASMTVWHDRIDKQLKSLQSPESDPQAEPSLPSKALIQHAQRAYARWRISADVIQPARAHAGLVVLMISLIVCFVLSNPAHFFGRIVSYNSLTWLIAIQKSILPWGELTPKLWQGEWWRAITYMFLHGNTAHLALNTGALYLFGKTVENMYGTSRFYVIFFGAGIISGILQLLITPTEPVIGASGAILGVFGGAIAGIVKLKHILPPHIRKGELKWMLSVAALQMIFDQLVNNLAEMTDKSNTGIRIASFAHCAGIVAGFAIGMLLPLRKRKELEGVDIGESSS